MRPIRRPGAVSFGAELQPNSFVLGQRLMALAVQNYAALVVDFDLIFDALADEKRRLYFAADHACGRNRCSRSDEIDIFRPNRDEDRSAGVVPARAVSAPEHHALRRAFDSDRQLTRRIAAPHTSPKKERLAEKVPHELVCRLLV